MSVEHELSVEPRNVFGSGESRRQRRAGKVPAVMYGAGKDNVNVVIDHDDLWHKLESESFASALIEAKGPSGSEQVILRAVQRHPYKARILHVDLQRVSATETINISIPLHFVGEDVAPGVKIDGGIVSHLMNDVEVVCLPKDLPEYLEVDVSELGMNDSVHLTDIKLPEGVELRALAHGGEDLSVFAVVPPKVEIEEEEEEALEAIEAGEAAEGEGEPESGSDEE